MRAGHGDGRAGKRRLGVAALDEAGGQQICRAVCMDQRRAVGLRFGGCSRCGSSVQRTGKSDRSRSSDRLALAGDQRHRLAAKPREPFGQRRLVGEGRDDAEAVLARECRRR